jgi:pimeloyl-ACP methyl ester carboxylesterase
MKRTILALLLAAAMLPAVGCAYRPIEKRVKHDFATNDGVDIHYVTLGKRSGPLVVMLHGFPDFWYTWRHLMDPLSENYRVAALDMRGYNLSGKPVGVQNYTMDKLIGDVAAVIRNEGAGEAIVIGHDWGGAVAWAFALNHPEMTDRLIVLNLPHPRGLARELANNPDQERASIYAQNFKREGAHLTLNSEQLARSVTKDPEAIELYVKAFDLSDYEAMLNYYKANYPDRPYQEDPTPVIKAQMPVLMIHGLDDRALLAAGLNNTWEWMEKDLTIVTIPGAGHFVQSDRPDLVQRAIESWLSR